MNRTFRAVVAATFAVTAAFLATGHRPAYAQANVVAPAERGIVHAQTTWDSNYLYILFQVEDTDVLGTSTLPLSDPQKDDSVGVYVQTGEAKPDAPNAGTHAMLVSAAGGFTFLAGDTDKKILAPKPIFTIKYGVTVQGTLNRSDDTDKGYTVEMAIPWSELGVDGSTLKAGTPFSINLITRDRTGKSFSSVSPQVKSEDDINVPSKWLHLQLAAAESEEKISNAILAPPIPARGGKSTPPLIDGSLRVAGEWPAAGKFTFSAPDTTRPEGVPAPKPTATTTVPLDNNVPKLTLTKAALKDVEPVLFARYALDYQGDVRKSVPFVGTIDPQSGHFLLADQPTSGAGPWFSSDRAAWHRGFLYEMRRSGVDSALVQIGGPATETGLADAKALLTLVESLREMTQSALPTPKIALLLDTAHLGPAGSKTDVSTPAGQARLYGAIRRFFATVPIQYRTRVELPQAAGGVPAYPVFLSDGTALSNTDGADWTEAVRKAFAEEFGPQTGGTTLVFVGGKGFDTKESTGLIAAGLPLTGDTGASTSGNLPAYTIQPGKETLDGKLTPRKDGETYKKSWEDALAAKTKWYILDSWNDFGTGTEIAASRQYGPRYQDLTRIYSVQTGNLEGIDLRWRDHDIPRRMRVGQTTPVTVSVQNGGGVALRPEDGYALSYRWKQGSKVIAEAPLRNRLDAAFLPTQTKGFLLGLSSLMFDGSDKLTPLPPGDYTLEVNFLKLADSKELGGTGEFLSGSGIAPLTVPVTLYSDDRQVAVIESTNTPALIQSGTTYPISVRLRWMGGDDLPAGSAQITWQLLTADGKTLVSTGSNPINDILPSGVSVPVLANLALTDSSGVAVPPAFPELPEGRGNTGGGYRLRWLLTRTDSTDAVPGELVEQIAVYGGDEEARIPLPDRIPESVEADSSFTVNLSVINRGSQPWKKGEYFIGSHWYYSDGVEASWKPSFTAPLPRDVAPGEEINVKLMVHAPETDGAYILVPDVAKMPDDYLSTHPVTRIGDIAPVYIRVTGGRLAFVDLSKIFNVDGVASEEKPTDGDIDEKGSTFPAESFPPDMYGVNAPEDEAARKVNPKTGKKPKPLPLPAYPSGYYSDVSISARRIAFRYGPTKDGAKNAVACAGQTIKVPQGNYGGLHMAATATGGEKQEITLKLTYSDKTTELAKITVRDWNTPLSTTGDAVAVMTRRKRTPAGDVAQPSYLRHIILPTSVEKQLVSITLPDDIKVKIFAMTLDK